MIQSVVMVVTLAAPEVAAAEELAGPVVVALLKEDWALATEAAATAAKAVVNFIASDLIK
jgi:hypothetical protein